MFTNRELKMIYLALENYEPVVEDDDDFQDKLTSKVENLIEVGL